MNSAQDFLDSSLYEHKYPFPLLPRFSHHTFYVKNNYPFQTSQCVKTLNGLLSFLLEETQYVDLTLVVCQCPKRASLISTASLPNPLKSRVSGTIFACNCQNILTTMLFHQFFGFFKVFSCFLNYTRNCQNILTILVFKEIFGFFCKFPLSLFYRPPIRFSILTFKLSIFDIFLLLTGIFLKILLPDQAAPKFSPLVQTERNNFAPATSDK